MESAPHQANQSAPRTLNATDLAVTILIAVAAILTAWAAFQHAKWNGEQAEFSRRAAASGLAASQATTVASAARSIDLGTFLSWLQAVRDDIDAGLIDPADSPYVPDPGTLSGFIAVRFRDDFRPGFEAWIETRPLVSTNAPATPFEMPEYKVTADEDVERFSGAAAAWADEARKANHNGENYVLLTVMFAVALVLTSVGSKLNHATMRSVIVGLAAATVLVAVVLMATYPVEI